jgi:hypothetical protein
MAIGIIVKQTRYLKRLSFCLDKPEKCSWHEQVWVTRSEWQQRRGEKQMLVSHHTVYIFRIFSRKYVLLKLSQIIIMQLLASKISWFKQQTYYRKWSAKLYFDVYSKTHLIQYRFLKLIHCQITMNGIKPCLLLKTFFVLPGKTSKYWNNYNQWVQNHYLNYRNTRKAHLYRYSVIKLLLDIT